MFNKLKNLFSSAKPDSDVDKIVPVFDVSSNEKNPKERAEELGEPYIAVISVDLDPDNIGNVNKSIEAVMKRDHGNNGIVFNVR